MVRAWIVVFIVLASLLVHPLDDRNLMIQIKLAVQLSKVTLSLLDVFPHFSKSTLILT